MPAVSNLRLRNLEGPFYAWAFDRRRGHNAVPVSRLLDGEIVLAADPSIEPWPCPAADGADRYLMRDSAMAEPLAAGRARGGDADTAVRVIATLLAPERRGQAASDLARDLLARFGTLSGVLRAARQGEAGFEALGSAARAKLGRVGREVERMAAEPRPATTSLVDRLVERLVEGLDMNAQIETLHVLFLDGARRLLESRVVARGTHDRCRVRTAEIAELAVALGAQAVILVHNHVSGDPTPSQADVLTTRWIEHGLRRRRIVLLDHVVTAGRRRLSMRALGMLGA